MAKTASVKGGGSNRTLAMLQADWSAGSRQDKPRDQIPGNAAWLLTDIFPDGNYATGTGFPLRSRNGWVRSCSAMSVSTSSEAKAVGFANFAGSISSAKIMGVDEDGLLYSWTPGSGTSAPGSDGAATSVGAAVIPTGNPIFYREKSYLLKTAATGYVYNGSGVTSVTGSMPQAGVGCVYKDHLVVANDGTNTSRVWFSSASDPDDWNTAVDGQWLDSSGPVNAIATFQNMILVFEDGFTERIRGDVIPGVLNSDFVREPLFPQGTPSPRSVCVTKEGVLFSNADGIFITDGLQVYDLTAKCGMGEYWRETLKPASANVNIVAYEYKDWYVFSVATSPYFAGALNLKTSAFVRFTNLEANMMVATPPTAYAYSPPRLFMAEVGAPNIVDIGVMLDKVSLYTNVDGDGTLVAPKVETRYYQGSDLSPKRWRSIYLTGGGDVPSGSTSIFFSHTPYQEPQTPLTSTFVLASQPTRSRVSFGQVSRGFAFTIEPAFSSSDTSGTGFHLDALEAEISPQYGRRR